MSFYFFMFLFVKRLFFFKQKTAYEIASCLVGSEMCIRDRMSMVQSNKDTNNASMSMVQSKMGTNNASMSMMQSKMGTNNASMSMMQSLSLIHI